MSLNADVQSLEPGALVVLYTLDATGIGADVYRFHSYGTTGNIMWQGVEYSPWPLEATGFEISGGQLPVPRLKMGNVGGFVGALCLSFDDLNGATLTRHRTLAKYLDGAPDADPDEHWPDDIWYVEQKVSETSEYVDFELSSALDFNGQQLPSRSIVANNCPWLYRGPECGYSGPPVATEYDIITTDAELDACGKRLQSCFMRFGEDNPLPFGGFPAAGLIG
jgi:lambda family phage minor tail protein L